MCGRYYRKSDKHKITEAFRLGNPADLPLEFATSYNMDNQQPKGHYLPI